MELVFIYMVPRLTLYSCAALRCLRIRSEMRWNNTLHMHHLYIHCMLGGGDGDQLANLRSISYIRVWYTIIIIYYSFYLLQFDHYSTSPIIPNKQNIIPAHFFLLSDPSFTLCLIISVAIYTHLSSNPPNTSDPHQFHHNI